MHDRCDVIVMDGQDAVQTENENIDVHADCGHVGKAAKLVLEYGFVLCGALFF